MNFVLKCIGIKAKITSLGKWFHLFQYRYRLGKMAVCKQEYRPFIILFRQPWHGFKSPDFGRKGKTFSRNAKIQWLDTRSVSYEVNFLFELIPKGEGKHAVQFVK